MRAALGAAGLGFPGAARELRHLLFFTPARPSCSRQAPAGCFQLCWEVWRPAVFPLGALSGDSAAHGSCSSEEASGFFKGAPNSKRPLLSSRICIARCYPHFKETSALDLEQGCLARPALRGLNRVAS